MAVDFEACDAALFARLQVATGVQYATRRLESWDDNPPSLRPALMMISAPITPANDNNPATPPLFLMRSTAMLYTNDPDVNLAPATQLNQLIAAVVNALLFQPGEAPAVSGAKFVAFPPGQKLTTLGGLVAYARVAEQIERWEGLIGDASAALIHLEMLVSS